MSNIANFEKVNSQLLDLFAESVDGSKKFTSSLESVLRSGPFLERKMREGDVYLQLEGKDDVYMNSEVDIFYQSLDPAVSELEVAGVTAGMMKLFENSADDLNMTVTDLFNRSLSLCVFCLMRQKSECWFRAVKSSGGNVTRFPEYGDIVKHHAVEV